MDLSIAATAATTPAGTGGVPQDLQQAPLASPELVGKFEALMARVGGPGGADTGSGAFPEKLVAKVEDQLAMHARTLDNVLAVGNGNMSLIDLQALQIQSIAQVGVMSMTHTAYMQVLSAGKGSVSSLMKNQ